jgi:hypothetical protein
LKGLGSPSSTSLVTARLRLPAHARPDLGPKAAWGAFGHTEELRSDKKSSALFI